MTWTFNPNQLATWAEARELIPRIDAFRFTNGVNMGGGVLPEAPDVKISGIFVPYWEGGPGGFPAPHAGDDKFWLHYRWANGKENNVGLMLDLLRRYGNNEQYVFRTVNANDLS